MNTDQVIDLIKFFGVVFGAVAGYITTVINTRKYLEKVASERSVGATKVIEFMDEHKKIWRRMEQIKDDFEKRDDKKSKEIKELAEEIRDFTFKALQLFNIQK